MKFFSKLRGQRTDQELLAAYQNNREQEAFRELYQRYAHLVLGLCLKYLRNPDDSKDAAVEIFELVHEQLFVQEIRNFKSWLYSVAKNHCLMILRKQKNAAVISISDELQNSFMENRLDLHLNEQDDDFFFERSSIG